MKTITVKINVPDDMPDETAYKYVIEAVDALNGIDFVNKRMSVDMNHVSACLDNKGSKETQEQKVKRILESGQTITSEEAVNDFNIPRLSAVIYALKERYKMNIVAERKMIAGKSLVAYVLRESGGEPESIIGKVFDTGTKKYGKVVAVENGRRCFSKKHEICVFSKVYQGEQELVCNLKNSHKIPVCYNNGEFIVYLKKPE